MCKPASMILTKEHVYWSRCTDSHDELITEHKLRESIGHNLNIQILRVEIAPSDGDLSADPATWLYNTDQVILPDWYNATRDEERARLALKDWVAAAICKADEIKLLGNQRAWAYDNSQVTAYDSSQVKASGNSQVRACDSSQVTAYDNSQVTAYDSSQVKAYGNSQVRACGSSQVTAYDRSQVKASQDSTVVSWNANEIELSDNAIEVARSASKPEVYSA